MGVARALSPMGNDEVRGFPPEVVCLIGQGVKRIRCQRSDIRHRSRRPSKRSSARLPAETGMVRKVVFQFPLKSGIVLYNMG